MAQGFKTGGRQKGTPNKVTSDMRSAIAESGESPLEYMVRVMRDKTADPSRRDDMARAAAPYLHPRLSAVDLTSVDHLPVVPVINVTVDQEPDPATVAADAGQFIGNGKSFLEDGRISQPSE